MTPNSVGVPRDVRVVLRDVRRVDDHHDRVGEAIDEAVVLDRAAIVENRRVVHLPDRERGDVVRRDVVDEIDGALAADHELAHVRDVEQAAALAHRLVLGGDALGVLHGHLVAGERDDLRAERDVLVVEGGALERARGGCCSHVREYAAPAKGTTGPPLAQFFSRARRRQLVPIQLAEVGDFGWLAGDHRFGDLEEDDRLGRSFFE